MRGYSYYDARTKSFTIKKDFDLRNIELRTFLSNQYKSLPVNTMTNDKVLGNQRIA